MQCIIIYYIFVCSLQCCVVLFVCFNVSIWYVVVVVVVIAVLFEGLCFGRPLADGSDEKKYLGITTIEE